ncbi:helix-turn-helix domain-containing protein [bacterium]|nr:helix-turn-helix domain-containing protein [bacterium]
MEFSVAVSRLVGLAQESRLAVFRALVRAGPDGLAAGAIARELSIAPNTLSAQLSILAHAGLVDSRRDGRSIIYTARFDTLGELLAFLIDECCDGRPEFCSALTPFDADPPTRRAPGRQASPCHR